ncbi:MAG: hypothetical protein ACT4NY_30055 [Pseudonocardiales bacterium]
MVYAVPGRADELPDRLVRRWNSRITAEFQRLRPTLGSRFFTIDPDEIAQATPAAVKWFGDPAEPAFCIGPSVARELSDWGVRGRQALHNEYCEYAAVHHPDQAGRLRLKRIQVTTELREYWLTIAGADPDALRAMTAGILGTEPSWPELYGVADPKTLSERGREVAFARLVAGHGNAADLVQAGVPAQPTGSLNTENTLFMTHPINGLDDLLYIVMFGAQPYFRRTADGFSPATREQIFRAADVEQLACRHADPAAAAGAHGAAVEGRTVAFADPLGVYIQSFPREIFLLDDQPIPDEWVRFSRGTDGMFQRLEVGPPDDDPAFLDQVRVATGAQDEPLVGGHQVVENVEVGPLVIVGPGSALADAERIVLDADAGPIVCREASICESIRALKAEFDGSGTPSRVAPRRMGSP